MDNGHRHRWLLWALLALLGGCGTSGGVKPPGAEPSSRSPTESPAAQPSPQNDQKHGQKPGGYYLDDGPGDHPPADIDAIPSAVPRAEPYLARANRPYLALGETYTPMTAYQPYRAEGVASWYGRRYHGQKTSSGETYDMSGMSAAHATLPIPSYARVSNPDNGKSVVVRINDRGPFKKERLIDLSYAAAYQLRLTGKGSGVVVVEAIDPHALEAKPAPARPTAQDASPQRSYVQVGAFKQKENAEQLRQKLQQDAALRNVAVESWYNDGVYRVRLGPYPSREEAERAAGQIKRALGQSPLVINPD